jgi:hypothetical protein
MKDLQNTPEWFEDRLGYITCSQLIKLKSPAPRDKYIMQLADERQGIIGKNFSTYHTKRGHDMEKIAIKVYEGINDVKTIPTGFIKSQHLQWFGGSPERLVGDNGLLEVKSFTDIKRIKRMRFESIPVEILVQIHGQIMVTGREWCDLVLFTPQFDDPKDGYFRKRIYADYDIQEQLEKEIIETNNAVYEELYKRSLKV